MTNPHSVVVTGIGLVTPLGLDLDSVAMRAINGESAIAPLQRLPVTGYTCQAGAEVPPVDLTASLRLPKNSKFMSLPVAYATRAAASAIACAGGTQSVDPTRFGIYTGSGQTGLETSEFFASLEIAETGDEATTFRNLGGRASRLVDRYWSLRTLANAGLGLMAAEFSAQGPCNNFVQGDTASAHALGAAFFDVAEGRCDMALAGGYDSLLTPSCYLSFKRSGMLSPAGADRAYRPFDRDRDGLVLGEGAAFVMLERYDRAQARGAAIYAELLGVGFAQELDDPPVAQKEATRLAIRRAAPDTRPDVVIAHGIGTRDGDRLEAELLAALGYDATPTTALKGLTAYLGATTAIAELSIAVLAARRHLMIPPVARLQAPDDECRLDLVRGSARPLDVDAPSILALSRSWSGQRAAIAARVSPVGGAGSSGRPV